MKPTEFALMLARAEKAEAEVERLREVIAVDPWTIGWAAWRARAALTPKGADHE